MVSGRDQKNCHHEILTVFRDKGSCKECGVRVELFNWYEQRKQKKTKRDWEDHG